MLVPVGTSIVTVFPPLDAPVPERETVLGELVALLVTVIDPLLDPAAVGVKITEMVQEFPAGNVALQVFVCEKSPEAAMLVIDKIPFPEFKKVMLCAELEVPTVWEEKVRVDGERVTPGRGVIKEPNALGLLPTVIVAVTNSVVAFTTETVPSVLLTT